MKKIKNTCWECGGEITTKKIDYILLGQNLGKFKAEVCKKCGEEVFSEEIAKEIDKVAKEKGLWGLEAKTKIGKVGNSFDIKINKKIADFLKLERGKEVILYPESKNKIVVLLA